MVIQSITLIERWRFWLVTMWAGDGRAMLLEDAAIVGAFLLAALALSWYVLRTDRRPRPRGFEAITPAGDEARPPRRP